MRRMLRLLAPAVSTTLFGLALLIFTPSGRLRFHGGLPVAVGYAFVCEIVFTLLLITMIDDSRDPRMLQARLPSDGQASQRFLVESGFDLKRALLSFYVWHAVPTLLLSFGISVNFSVLMLGVLDGRDDSGFLNPLRMLDAARRVGFYIRPSELVAGVFVVGVAIPLLVVGGKGFFGWVVGASAGTALAQMRFDLDYFLLTGGSWMAFAAVFCLVGYVATKAIPAIRRRRLPRVSASGSTIDLAER